MQRTKVANYDDALDIIEHVNEDHTSELKAIVASKFPERDVERVALLDVFEEGILMGIFASGQTHSDELFVPFEIKGTLQERIFYLAYAYSDPNTSLKETRRFLTVTDTSELTDNFTRITLRTDLAFPQEWAGLCFSTHLKVFAQAEKEQKKPAKLALLLSRLGARCSLFLMKVLPVKMRRSMVKKSRKDIRPYTLRNTWQEDIDGKTQYFGIFDVFTHGSSQGSVWANSLKQGDIIYTSGDHIDNHPALAQGKNVIFCDETAFPAAAGLLEQWENPLPPTLIVVSQRQSEQAYFDDVKLPQNTKILRIVYDFMAQGDKVIDQLKSIEGFDTVWGAMESSSAKKVRDYLRNTYKLKGPNNLVKPYWVVQDEKE